MASSFGTESLAQMYVPASGLLVQRDISPELNKLFVDDAFMFIMKQAGRIDISKTAQYTTLFDSELFNYINTTGGTIVSGNNSPTIVITLTAPNSGVATVGYAVRFNNNNVGRVQGISTASGADTLTITALDVTSNLALTIGDNLALPFIIGEEGSLAAPTVKWDVGNINNQCGIIYNAYKITDVAGASWLEVNITDPNGKETKKITSYQGIRAYNLHQAMISNSLFTSQISATNWQTTTPNLVGASGLGVQSTRGIDQYITQLGLQPTVGTPGSITLTDITNMENLLAANRAPTRYMLFGSTSSMLNLTHTLKNLPSANVLPSVKLNMDGKTVDFNVDQWNDVYEFSLVRATMFDDPKVYNMNVTTGVRSLATRSIYGLPLDAVETYTNGTVPHFGAKIKKPSNIFTPANEFGTIETSTGALAPNGATSQEMAATYQYTTWVGAVMNRPQVAFRWTTLAA